MVGCGFFVWLVGVFFQMPFIFSQKPSNKQKLPHYNAFPRSSFLISSPFLLLPNNSRCVRKHVQPDFCLTSLIVEVWTEQKILLPK